MLEERGMNAIEVSGNVHGKAEKMIGQEYDQHAITEHGYFVEYGKVIASDLDIPVYVTGGYRNNKEMEAWLNESELTGFGMCRPLLSEPDLVSHWKNGEDKTARCVFCSKCRTPEGNYCTTFAGK
jgi:2,4-dienoyl-CoA reductase-like NADH-dependent reductase (Old Yellow Enzyme family)